MQLKWLPTTLLVDLPNWVGDQMMALPALQRLVEGNRGGLTVLHTRPNLTRFLAAVFPEAAVVSSPHKRSPLSAAKAAIAAHRRFEVGVTFRNAARGKLFIRLAARRCIGSRGEGALLLMTISCAADRARHQVHDADGILDVVGLDPADPSWTPVLPPELADEGVRIFERFDLDRRQTIVLAPTSARGTSKCWPAGRFAELANVLRESGLEPLLAIGPGEEAVADSVRHAAGFNLPVVGSDLDVAGLAAVVSGARGLVGNDSGPMQLAAALDTPAVAIFGPTDPARTGPRGARHRIVTASAARGGGMRDISVSEVETAVLDLL
jgi:ADP-heptose:LPS heptosyltransferase